MGWFNSDKELRERERQVEQKYTEIKTLLQQQQNEIMAHFQNLGNLGASIMTQTDLEAIYKEQLKNLDIQKEALAGAIDAYQAAAERFSERERELVEREKAVVAKECDAKSEFAATLEEQMQPLRQLKEELDAKGQRVLAMQEEFNQNFALQDQKLLTEFQRQTAAMRERFEGLQAELLKEKQSLADREDALNKREMALSLREAEVRQGLTGERAQMLSEFNDAKLRLAQQEEGLKRMAEELSQKRLELQRQESDLAGRLEAVQARETVAEAGFAKEKESALSEIQVMREETAKNLVELQRQANAQCDQFLQDWQKVLSEARGKMLEGITGDVQERRAALASESQNILQQKNDLLQREQELLKRENAAQVAQEAARQREQFLAEKEKLMEERLQRIAQERIAAVQLELEAVQQSKAELSQKFAALQMEMAKYRAETQN